GGNLRIERRRAVVERVVARLDALLERRACDVRNRRPLRDRRRRLRRRWPLALVRGVVVDLGRWRPLALVRRVVVLGCARRPVDPKPPVPRSVASSSSTSTSSAWTTGAITSWAIRSAGLIVTTECPRLIRSTVT